MAEPMVLSEGVRNVVRRRYVGVLIEKVDAQTPSEHLDHIEALLRQLRPPPFEPLYVPWGDGAVKT